MEKAKSALRNTRQQAQGLVEYGLILAVIAMAAIAIMTRLGANLTQVITDVTGHMVSGG